MSWRTCRRIFEVEFFAESPPDKSRVLEFSKLEYEEDGFLIMEVEARPPGGYPELRHLGVNI